MHARSRHAVRAVVQENTAHEKEDPSSARPYMPTHRLCDAQYGMRYLEGISGQGGGPGERQRVLGSSDDWYQHTRAVNTGHRLARA
eukprot:3548746-Rhodomonas_salina.3